MPTSPLLRVLRAPFSFELPQLVERSSLSQNKLAPRSLDESLNRSLGFKRDEQPQILVQLRR